MKKKIINFLILTGLQCSTALVTHYVLIYNKATPIKCLDFDDKIGQLKLEGWLYIVFILYTILKDEAPFYRCSLTIIYSSYLPGLFDTLFIPPAVLQALFTVCSIVWSIGVPVKGFVLRWTVKSISCWSAGESSLISERYIGKYLK